MAMQAQDIKVVSGRLERHPEFKSQYVAARDVAVWLPDGYSQKETYDVLYMHDGQALFDANTNWNKQEWRVDDVAGQLIAGKKTRPFIVVAIWNSGATRHSDYFPQKPFESLTQKQKDSLYALGGAQPLFAAKVGSDNYLKFIVKELMPFVEHTYSVKKGKEHTFVAGSSMGGLISMYALCEYPDVFGGAACLSTHWIGTFETKDNPIPKAFQNYLKRNLPSPMTHKIYFDYGDQTLDAVYEPYQKEVDLILMAKGYDARNWTTQKFPGAEHAEHSWAERLDIPLMFLLGR
ncbi:Putative esterase [Flavobacterium caeni]|uniref:Putative esterase n=2 Tax=Flavobacterium caeni TaxID=490189 RepID=A0A1G5APL6_9FLAO|nr:Putative esterase [Flavobacterium caeni]